MLRLSCQRIAGLRGLPFLSTGMTVARWLVTMTAATPEPEGFASIASFDTSIAARHQTSGSCSTRNGPG